MNIIRENGHDYLLTDKEVSVYFQGNKIAQGQGKLDLGVYSELQPVFEVNGIKIARTHCEECGILNLRDLGGIPTSNGKQIAYHNFYRGAIVLPKNDIHKEHIDSLELKEIVDFRSESEINGRNDYIPIGCDYIRLSGLKMLDKPEHKGSFDFENLVKTGNIYHIKKYMLEMYQSMAVENDAFKYLIQLLKEEKTPLYFHCTAGKDRTGVGAALILLCLGVDEQEVYKEYLLSNIYRKEFNEMLLSKIDENYREDIKPLYYVQEDYLKRTLDEIKRIYGNYDVYFEKEHHLTKEMRLKLQEKYCI